MRKTVLVLGAGASCPYGFPSAGELRELITQKNDAKVARAVGRMKAVPHLWSSVHSYLLTRFNEETIAALQNNFFLSQATSIDAFVKARGPVFDEVARHTLAALFLNCEATSYLDGDWYQLLWATFFEYGPKLPSQHISIVTFNYDRSLENYLWNAIQYSYGVPVGVAFRRLCDLPLIHVHGSLGTIYSDLNFQGHNCVPWKSLEPVDIAIAAESLKLVTPQAASTEQVKQHLNNAERVCFIGFGFWPENLNLIAKEVPPKCEVYASCLGLSERRIKTVTAIFPNIVWGTEWDARKCFVEWDLFG